LKTQGKVWGQTTEFFRNALVSAHHLSIKQGGYCSEHKHEYKYNIFYIISGKLKITIWRDKSMKDVTTLKEGQVSAVPPGLWHCFEALEDSEVIEMYQVLLHDPDIERRTQGGMRKK